MVAEILGAVFTVLFGGFFIGAALLGVIELFGRIYGTFRCFVRNDLSTEQRLIYLGLIWFVPLGWLIYFVLGTEKTSELFSDVDFV